MAERFDGASWQYEPVAYGGAFPYLGGVSCLGRYFCMAVGGDNLRMLGKTLSAIWTP